MARVRPGSSGRGRLAVTISLARIDRPPGTKLTKKATRSSMSTTLRPYVHVLKSNTPIPLDDPIWRSFLADEESLGTDARDLAAVMVASNSQTHNFVNMIRLTVQQLHDTMSSASALWGSSPPSSPVHQGGLQKRRSNGNSGDGGGSASAGASSSSSRNSWTAEQLAQTLTVVKVIGKHPLQNCFCPHLHLRACTARARARGGESRLQKH